MRSAVELGLGRGWQLWPSPWVWISLVDRLCFLMSLLSACALCTLCSLCSLCTQLPSLPTRPVCDTNRPTAPAGSPPSAGV